MGEEAAIETVDEPVTVPSIVDDLRELGIEAGETLLVHTSMSSLGWVSGGAPAVVDALREVLTETGTLVMPTHSTQNSDPTDWRNPPVPDDWEATIRETTPPYRPEVTPTRGMGAVPECFRTYPDTVRSDHPSVSFAAWGSDAESIVAGHSLDDRFGEDSPLARVYDRDGDVLLLGVGHDRNTSLHLAEYRAADPVDPETETAGSAVLRDGERVWVEYEHVAESSDDFPAVGADFEESREYVEGTVGAATAKLLDQAELVDFAADWFAENR